MTRESANDDPLAGMLRKSEAAWGGWLSTLTPKSKQVCEQLVAAATPVEPPQLHVLLVPEMAEAELRRHYWIQPATIPRAGRLDWNRSDQWQ